ncbi:hypothetical protein [Sediminispirochaeta smaragdinae]|jgi:hypothetical protein|uniref:Uncharacterized protein n=1 Tax=Sediminispirochaeta smaragdinae (strain DSM 11293 / JCM 15392 / SEBR 4228) TaxID=573413 RepID=E1R1V9_SEDSS|nr:hypothetical protein [Sediminispirochaeta smaragdinae]ADK81485.1 hypothetical protein Spirs_2370 [Sediminispirochaeta smaragdinae DSM 11293]
MFFFFGPFEYLLPFLIVYFVIRSVTRNHTIDRSRRGRFPEFYDEDPFDDDDSRAIDRNLRASLYRLADRQKGKLTVSDVVIETGIAVQEAEKILQAMVDNQHVRMEVRDDGIIYYEFPEIMDKYTRGEN